MKCDIREKAQKSLLSNDNIASRMESLIQIILRKTGPESFSGQLSVDRADVIARKKGDGKASHRKGNFRKCSQLCPNLFADRKMEGAARRASGEGE